MKSPLVKARDKWFLGKNGKRCCQGTATGQYLIYRLEEAFIAGYDVSQERIEELEDLLREIKEEPLAAMKIEKTLKG